MALVAVRYKGLSDIRIIPANDPGLRARGIKVDGQMRWDRQNNWKIFIDGLSEDLEQLFRDEGTFTIEEVDEETGKTVKTIVKATRSDDTGATVKDGTTGQVSVNPKGQTGAGRST